jgi:hypothetical protein
MNGRHPQHIVAVEVDLSIYTALRLVPPHSDNKHGEGVAFTCVVPDVDYCAVFVVGV